MKFLLGMLTGILLSTMFFIWYAKKNLVADNNTPTTEVVEPVSEAMPMADEDFLEFYERFHTDSAYQVSHITFPLAGVPKKDSLGNYPADFQWEEERWILHRPFDDVEGQFEQNLMKLGEGMMVEEISSTNGMLSMQRRFARIGEKWNLIYYAAMNQTRRE
ncbi:MAG: DUF4348 domain-containing protein [Saprospiraceae bacterium]